MSLYNLRNPAVKRLMKEAEELLHPTEEYHAQPIEDNLFEWHFSLRGPPNTDFEGGIYHGRITLPPDYPMKPPSIILLTPNGRFETNKKICLSISGHHPESWQPSWSIRTALLAIIGFMPTHGNGALGSLDYTPEERQQLALKSQDWQCPECGHIKDIFMKKSTPEGQKDNSHSSELIPDSETKANLPNTTSSSENSPNTSPEKSLPTPIDIKEEETVLVQRQKHLVGEDVSENVVTITKQTTGNDSNNALYSVIIFVIIFTIMFLLFRRLFSM